MSAKTASAKPERQRWTAKYQYWEGTWGCLQRWVFCKTNVQNRRANDKWPRPDDKMTTFQYPLYAGRDQGPPGARARILDVVLRLFVLNSHCELSSSCYRPEWHDTECDHHSRNLLTTRYSHGRPWLLATPTESQTTHGLFLVSVKCHLAPRNWRGACYTGFACWLSQNSLHWTCAEETWLPQEGSGYTGCGSSLCGYFCAQLFPQE